MYFARQCLDYLTGSALGGERDDRDELLRSILDRRWAIVIGAVCVAVTAVLAALITDVVWPLFWLGADVILTVARWKTMSTASGGNTRERQQAWHLLAVLTLLWSFAFGIAMFFLVQSGDLALLVNAAVLTISVSSAITYRNAAMPRTAILAILLVTVPFLVGAGIILVDHKWVIPVVGIPLLLSSYSLTLQNHAILVRLIAAERQAHALAHIDALTGLPNRLSFAKHQEDLTKIAGRRVGYAYMCLDLDGFKQVNDRYGHPAGDLLLKAVAQRLKQMMRSSDIVFRIGGDEFIVYMPDARPDDCAFVASRLISFMAEPFMLSDDLTVIIGCSAGSACLTTDESSAARILGIADEALYKAKRDGKSRHVHAA